jgi:uncharacterized lipoprotein YddW (UPF0748 family)
MLRAYIIFLILSATGLAAATAQPGAEPRVYRALWVDAFHPGLKDAKEVRKLVDEARAAHFNTLFIQVRRRGEVFYNSLYDPKAPEVAPAFDPLAEVIRLAHDTSTGPRLEVHAWMVAFPIWNDQRLPKSEKHFFRNHPDWISKDLRGISWDGESFNFDPANPNVQRYLFSLAMELVARYDIDGLSLDRIRYPGNEWGYTTTALARFALFHSSRIRPNPTDPAWLEFRREQVTALVRKIYLSAIQQKPGLKISASTITWSPSISALPEWSTSTPYQKVLQDWRSWMKEGILDLNVPMDYYRHSSGRNDFVKWAMFAADQSYGHQVIIGCAGYLNNYAEGREQLRMVEAVVTTNSAIQGISLYSYATPSNVTNSSFATFATSGWLEKPEMIFSTSATVPPMPWKTMAWTGHIKGFVRAKKKLATLEGVRILITGGKARSITTDATGFYGFANVEPGLYNVVASAPGYIPATNRLVVTKGKVATSDFLLLPGKQR